MELCAICGRRAEAEHHLIFGRGMRNLCDEDGLTIPICNHCHNMSTMSIHDHTSAEQLSKMLGQALFERRELIEAIKIFDEEFAEYMDSEARNRFLKRYGRGWL